MRKRRARRRLGALLVAVVLILGTTVAVISRTDQSAQSTAAAKPKPRALDIFHRINDERAARNLPKLRWDVRLATRSWHWSKVMADEHRMHHSNIGKLLGPYNYVGENIAYASPGTHTGTLHVRWMRSQEHRDNDLAPGFQNIGVGLACGSDGTIWATVEFARPASSGRPSFAAGPSAAQPIARSDPNKLGC